MPERNSLAIISELLDAHQVHDEAGMAATLSEDFTYEEFGTQRRAEGRDAFLAMWRGWRQVFPDVEGTIEHGFVSGDQAVAETLWQGTFSGDLVVGGQTFTATGQRMEHFPVAFVCTVADGQLTEMRAYFDVATLMQQIWGARLTAPGPGLQSRGSNRPARGVAA